MSLLVLGVVLLVAGGFLIALGGWNIDFAHAAWERNEPTVGIPWIRGSVQVDRAFWWNLGLFGFTLPGAVLAAVGGLLIGLAV